MLVPGPMSTDTRPNESRMSQSDRLYATSRPHLVDFTFDQSVADVFPDMIRRSVPGYDALIATLGVLAKSYYQPGTRIYDLGCSLGAATLSVHHGLGPAGGQYVMVDNATAMMQRCRQSLGRLMPDAVIDYQETDIRDVRIRQASMVMLNFTVQFVPREDRQAILSTIHAGLVPGGILVLSEKILGRNTQQQQHWSDLHHAFKAANGYSELEISQKRSALEKVLRPETIAQHQERLAEVGFSSIWIWFQCLNFVSFLAIR